MSVTFTSIYCKYTSIGTQKRPPRAVHPLGGPTSGTKVAAATFFALSSDQSPSAGAIFAAKPSRSSCCILGGDDATAIVTRPRRCETREWRAADAAVATAGAELDVAADAAEVPLVRGGLLFEISINREGYTYYVVQQYRITCGSTLVQVRHEPTLKDHCC